jgi:DUF2075 family protein
MCTLKCLKQMGIKGIYIYIYRERERERERESQRSVGQPNE